jgi:hypothetical protein
MPADEGILVQYLRRSYQAVDGLWFMQAENATDFDTALEVDRRVWEIAAKIQAREARRLLKCEGTTPQELERCLALKFAADGHDCESRVDAEGVRVLIHRCPWQQLLEKSKRLHLAERIAHAICHTEGRVWCEEFGGAYAFEMPAMICAGAEQCEMRFRRK